MATSRAARKFEEAKQARDALCAALRRAGVQLPAMDVRSPFRVDGGGYALVNLGECAAPVALLLAAVIEKDACEHTGTVRRADGGTYCGGCDRKVYL